MSSLVADYGSSDESDKEEYDGSMRDLVNESVLMETHTKVADQILDVADIATNVRDDKKKKKKKLLNPLLKKKAGIALLQRSSVFYNPFLKEIDSKKVVLERHVKMTENPSDVKEINGKKICWNHRKGKCRFGHNCKYAHQSDLANGNKAPPDEDDKPSAVSEPLMDYLDDSAIISSEDNKNRKRKPGLSDSLMPNKKALKMYKKQQQSEQPWLRRGGP